MKELPQEFCEKMQDLLGEEYDAYRQSMEQDSYTAVRINTNKISVEAWDGICPFRQKPVSWTDRGRYYDSGQSQPSKHPYYFAGLYYIQEPSAMIPASILPVQPGDRVLDLCAAPGGKATEIAAKLQGKGMLVANDISVSRTMALAKNLQMAGAVNAVVTAETPIHLAEYFLEYFDALLIDAPCSGEGMFRRDPHMVADWLEHGPEYYAGIQREILQSAYRMLRPGGYMVYSTCTFSPVENEEMIGWFLAEYGDMVICPVERCPEFADGRPDLAGAYRTESLRHAVRIFPHRADGEGHFAVLLQKREEETGRSGDLQQKRVGDSLNDGTGQTGEEDCYAVLLQKREEDRRTAVITRKNSDRKPAGKKQQADRKLCTADPVEKAAQWLERLGIGGQERSWRSRLHQKQSQIVLLPEELREMRGLRLIQSGLIVGSMKKERFEPSPQLALAVQDTSGVPVVSFASEDIRVVKYLKGETVESAELSHAEVLNDTDGYVLVCVDGFPLGWAKWMKDGRLKNKYYAGWRMQ